MSKTTPTQRTLARLRAEGYTAEVVEKRLPRCFITRDLFGCIDVLAVRPGSPPLGVQCTSRPNQAARLNKAVALPELRAWLASGATFEVWGWARVGPRGKRKAWDVTRRAVLPADLPAAAPGKPEDAAENAVAAPSAATVGGILWNGRAAARMT